MSRKYQVTLPRPVAEQLEELAVAADLPPSTLAAQLVQNEVARAAVDGKVRRLRRRLVTPRATMDTRARWLEPYGGDAGWRADMWRQIVALHGRYPKALAGLQQGWWNETELTEVLGALVVWRAELDDTGMDPQEELAFRLQLKELAQALQQAGGGVTNAWKPGVPPSEWSA